MSTISATSYRDGRTLFFPNDQISDAQNNGAISHNSLEEPKSLRGGTQEAVEHALKIQNLFSQLKETIQKVSHESDLEFADKDSSEASQILSNPNSKFVQLTRRKLKLEKELDLALAKAQVTLNVKSLDGLSPARWRYKVQQKVNLAMRNLLLPRRKTWFCGPDEVSHVRRNRQSREILRAALPSWRDTRSSSVFI